MNSTLKIFVAEIIGTFILVVFATGSIVIDGKNNNEFGISFIALLHFIGLAIAVYAFAKISMANFNPAVTIGFMITRHIKKNQFITYFVAQIIGAIAGSIFVKHILGNYGNLGTNIPNYDYSIPVIFGTEVLATALLMGVILIVVHTKGLKGFGGVAIAGIVAIDVLLFANISAASMNPIRSLAPALVSNILGDLWIFWSAPFLGSAIMGIIYRKIITNKKNQ